MHCRELVSMVVPPAGEHLGQNCWEVGRNGVKVPILFMVYMNFARRSHLLIALASLASAELFYPTVPHLQPLLWKRVMLTTVIGSFYDHRATAALCSKESDRPSDVSLNSVTRDMPWRCLYLPMESQKPNTEQGVSRRLGTIRFSLKQQTPV